MERVEQRWKEIELQIQEAILRRGVPNVNVSFIGDTAYLRGNVRTPDDSYKAELAAKTIPDVKYVHNGIWVKR
jgi:osmotically-inducible protein OsmY